MIERILGTSEEFPIEHRLLNGSCIMAAIFSAGILLNNLLLGLDATLNLMVGFSILLSVILYYFARVRGYFRLPMWGFMIFCLTGIPVGWFLNSGVFGSTIYICFVLLALITILTSGKTRIIVSTIFTIEIVAAIVIEYQYPGLVVPYKNRFMQFVDIIINFTFSFAILAAAIILVMKNYEREKRKADESNRLKSSFLANISHEIRTPMNSILGFSELLRDEQLQPDAKQHYIEIIRKNGTHLLELINDMIDLARIESGQFTISEKPFSLEGLMSELYDLYRPQIQERITSFRLAMPPLSEGGPGMVIADDLRIRQVLTNLIGNAVKFTHFGVIEFGCRVTESGRLLFHVSDTGIGIDKEHVIQIFQQFKQADDSHTRQYGGAGLGLSISKKLVNLLGGDIWLESTPGKGTTFFFDIPFRPAGDAGPPRVPGISTPEPGNARDRWKSRSVLVVEDDNDSYRFLERLMSRYGINVLRSVNGQEAVSICRSTPGIDCVLMDIQLPFISGNDATKRIREFNRDVPIIAQSGNAYESDRMESINAGCNDFISKPIHSEKLLAILDKYL